jgi:molybdate transport system permease protein
MDLDALLLTLRLALTTTILLMIVAVPLAWWISVQRGLGRAVIQTIVALPLVLPPTVIGFYLLIALGPLTPVGRMWVRLVGHPLAFSFAGLLVGSLLYSLPFAVQPLVAGFRAIGPGYADAAASLGVGPWRTFREVLLPMTRGALLTAIVLTFTHTVGEFGVVLMLGGNIPGATRTLSISLYDQVQDFDYVAANHTALLLLVVAAVALLLIYLLPDRKQGRQGDFVG